MAENTNLTLTVEAWADIVIKEWEKKIEALGIGSSKRSTGELLRSFEQHVRVNANGDPTKIEFAFSYYGKMVDYGVGKNVTLHDRDSKIAAGLTRRKPKPWYSDTFYNQLAVLRHLISEKTARNIEKMIIITSSDSNNSL